MKIHWELLFFFLFFSFFTFLPQEDATEELSISEPIMEIFVEII